MQKLFYPIRDNSDVGISRSSSYTLTTQRKNTASSMTKGEIAEFTDWRSQPVLWDKCVSECGREKTCATNYSVSKKHP